MLFYGFVFINCYSTFEIQRHQKTPFVDVLNFNVAYVSDS